MNTHYTPTYTPEGGSKLANAIPRRPRRSLRRVAAKLEAFPKRLFEPKHGG